MGLRDALERHNVPIPADFDERLDIIVSGLKRKPDYKKKLEAFKAHKGGADPVAPPLKRDPEDWLGPRMRWFLVAVTSPYGRTILEGLFMVIFFLSYLEAIPVFGSILSAALDLVLAGGKILIKTVQNALPPAIGMIPLPYTSLAGIVIAAVFGMIVWPIIAIISFSRQDFVSAIESYIRVIPPPIGDILANNFLEVNRTVARLDEKRIKVGNDISRALTQLSVMFESVSSQMQQGFAKLSENVKAVANKMPIPTTPAMPTMPPAPTAPVMPFAPTAPVMPFAPTAPVMPTPTVPLTPTASVTPTPVVPLIPTPTPAVPVTATPAVSALDRLRSQKTSFAAPKLTKGGFHRRTKRKSWRTRTTRTTRVLGTRRKSGRR
jgi:hypothetical protein